MRRITATPEHEACHQAIAAALKPFADKLDAADILAILCVQVGMAIALQDQRRWTRSAVMELVMRNIEAGNARVIDELNQTKGQA